MPKAASNNRANFGISFSSSQICEDEKRIYCFILLTLV